VSIKFYHKYSGAVSVMIEEVYWVGLFSCSVPSCRNQSAQEMDQAILSEKRDGEGVRQVMEHIVSGVEDCECRQNNIGLNVLRGKLSHHA
jgi:hypothetical protein